MEFFNNSFFLKSKRQKNRRFFGCTFLPKNRKALSGIIVTLLLIALTLVIAGVVFKITKEIIGKNIEKSKACGIDNFDKISINSNYVCYDQSTDKVVFSINLEDIEIDKLLISISDETDSDIFEIDYTPRNLGLVDYPNRNVLVTLPNKKSGKTYIATGIIKEPTQIQIVPVINGEQCPIFDTINSIPDCF